MVKMTLLTELQSLLKKDKRLVKGSELLTNTATELALKMDKDLIKLLLSEKKIRKHFFVEVGGTLIFDRDKFIEFISNEKFLPDSYTKFKQNIGLTTDSEYLVKSGEVVLSWPYKDCILEGGQEKGDEKRNEIFYNEILAPDQIDRLLDPKVFTNFKRIDAKGERKVTEIKPTDNLTIKGNNLLVLYSLKKRFAEKVKLIYIDPPYNTGNDEFKYNDSFNHSTWLTFMKNRLDVAKELLSSSGFLFVQISFHEYAYLKTLLDEIFKGNHVVTLNILVRHPGRILKGDKDFHDVIEYILVYTKDKTRNKIEKIKVENKIDEYIYKIKLKGKGKPIKLGNKIGKVFLPREYELIREQKPSKENLQKISVRGALREANSSGRFYVKFLEPLENEYPPLTLFKIEDFGADILGYRFFYTPPEGTKNGGYFQALPLEFKNYKLKPYPNFFDFIKAYNNVVDEGGVRLRHAKKPETLLNLILNIAGVKKEDIILDFNLGSGTTCAVAHKLGIRYIGIEQLDYGKNNAVVRLKNVINGDQTGISRDVNWKGGGDFVYCELKELNELFVRKLLKAKSKSELLKIWKAMKRNGFLSYRVNKRLFDENIEEFKKLPIDEQRRLLIGCLDKNHLYVNYSEIEDKQYKVSKGDIAINRKFYEGT